MRRGTRRYVEGCMEVHGGAQRGARRGARRYAYKSIVNIFRLLFVSWSSHR